MSDEVIVVMADDGTMHAWDSRKLHYGGIPPYAREATPFEAALFRKMRALERRIEALESAPSQAGEADHG